MSRADGPLGQLLPLAPAAHSPSSAGTHSNLTIAVSFAIEVIIFLSYLYWLLFSAHRQWNAFRGHPKEAYCGTDELCVHVSGSVSTTGSMLPSRLQFSGSHAFSYYKLAHEFGKVREIEIVNAQEDATEYTYILIRYVPPHH